MLTQEHRPRRLKDVSGQVLAKSILSAVCKRPASAPRSLIFSGERGLGKTTCSRILVRALNCERHDGDCCNECKSCKSIGFGGGQLYIELDSGVVGNVDTMREIRDTLAYAVSDGYRVVNLDETQLVSKAGQGTLLKVLEEAPSGVFFVMCTTNPELLLPTIVSRSLVVPFELLSYEEMCAHLRGVADKEGVQVSNEALGRAARRVSGHVRDGLQQLEMIRLVGEQEYLSTFRLMDEQFAEMIQCFMSGNSERAREIIIGVVSNPVLYVEQDFGIYMRRLMDKVFLDKAGDTRLKEVVQYWLRMHRYLKSSNDWYLFLLSLGGVLKVEVKGGASVAGRFSR
ncbi:MAG: AAA family ATPase [Patescibacteria group bacterium]|jgi:DNA polymerase III subunit gamma/tau|nr:AAA family ATPase [Patescibacteria group bacterium]